MWGSGPWGKASLSVVPKPAMSALLEGIGDRSPLHRVSCCLRLGCAGTAFVGAWGLFGNQADLHVGAPPRVCCWHSWPTSLAVSGSREYCGAGPADTGPQAPKPLPVCRSCPRGCRDTVLTCPGSGRPWALILGPDGGSTSALGLKSARSPNTPQGSRSARSSGLPQFPGGARPWRSGWRVSQHVLARGLSCLWPVLAGSVFSFLQLELPGDGLPSLLPVSHLKPWPCC